MFYVCSSRPPTCSILPPRLRHHAQCAEQIFLSYFGHVRDCQFQKVYRFDSLLSVAVGKRYFFSLSCLEAGKDCWRASNISRYQEKTPRWARRSSGGRGQQERVIVSGRRFVRIGIFVRTVTVTCSARKFKIVNFTSEDSAATLPAFPFVGSTPNTSWVSKTGATSESFF